MPFPTQPIPRKLLTQEIVCDRCGSKDYRKNGLRTSGFQSYCCKDCGYQFSARSIQEIACYHCKAKNSLRQGKTPQGKQKYFCRDCERYFVLDPITLLGEPAALIPSEDVWYASELGLRSYAYQSRVKFSFLRIHQDWLKEAIKKFVKYKAATLTASTLKGYLINLNVFSKFLDEEEEGVKSFRDIERHVILDFISYVRQMGNKRLSPVLTTLRLLFETGNLQGWFDVPVYLIRPEDYSRRSQYQPRFIPEEVMRQINQNLGQLPDPFMRMMLVLQECGLRIGELLLLPLNCLHQDAQGAWFIQFRRWKMDRETILPVSPELATVIQEQQQFIRKNLGTDFDYLFCARKSRGCRGDVLNYFDPRPKIMYYGSFKDTLNKFAAKFNICDSSGKLWHFQAHQFRHTVATRMINSGVPLSIIQRYLGHVSPEMTLIYAHIHDKTLRQEIEKFHLIVVNIAGETLISDNPELDQDSELQWMRKSVLAQSLPNGSCARPVISGPCPHANACLTCGDFRTTREFLGIHQEELSRTEKVIEKAKANGWQRQVEMNERVRQNLENMIQSLESNRE